MLLTIAWLNSSALASPAPVDGWFVDMKRYSQSAHTGIACQDCHGPMNDLQDPHPPEGSPGFLTTDIKKTFDYGKCQTCHPKAYERYQAGAHEEARKIEADPARRGELKHPAPTCGHCHSAHYAESHRSRVATGQAMVTSCGACHLDQQRSYLENYHGKAAVNLGDEKAAYCTDCHGAHTCLDLNKDKTAALNACRRCHADANENFSQIVIHSSTTDLEKKAPEKRVSLSKIHTAGTISFVLVACVLVFFFSHSFMLLLRKLHDKLRKHE